MKNPAGNRQFETHIPPHKKTDETNPKVPGAVPTNRHISIPIDFGPVSGFFDDASKLLNCEIAQPRLGDTTVSLPNRPSKRRVGGSTAKRNRKLTALLAGIARSRH